MPSVTEVLGGFLRRVPREQHPVLIALAERLAAERYHGWAAEGGPGRRRGLLACAEREEEIARRVEGLHPGAGDTQRALVAAHPDLLEVNRSLFAGRALEEQFAVQAEGERLGAATWRALAETAPAAARTVYLDCAVLEEESAAFLERQMTTGDLLVVRRDLRRCTVERGSHPDGIDVGPGQALLAIDAFALTANNITYAVFGEQMGYWQFFPSRGDWGRVPVWGFADVVRSRHDAVPVGERVYGYFPMSTHLVVHADHVTDESFVDAAPHRRPLPPVYNQYTRVARDPSYDPRHEAQQMLFRPLFTTAFLLDDLFAERDFFGARTVLVASASSKTALALAFLLSRRRRCRVVGLTSPAHAEFVQRVGCYDDVIAYSGIPELPTDAPAMLVDMAGSGKVLAAVHGHLGDQLRHSCLVGATHWEAPRPEGALPGPQPEFFFAPDRLRERVHAWGPDGFQSRVGAAWRDFVPAADAWIRVVRRAGGAAVEAAYREMLEGETAPDRGLILSL